MNKDNVSYGSFFLFFSKLIFMFLCDFQNKVQENSSRYAMLRAFYSIIIFYKNKNMLNVCAFVCYTIL